MMLLKIQQRHNVIHEFASFLARNEKLKQQITQKYANYFPFANNP